MSLSCSLSSTDYPISRAAKSQVLTSPNLLYSVPSPSLPSPFSLSSPTCSPQPLGWHLRLPPGSHLLTPLRLHRLPSALQTREVLSCLRAFGLAISLCLQYPSTSIRTTLPPASFRSQLTRLLTRELFSPTPKGKNETTFAPLKVLCFLSQGLTQPEAHVVNSLLFLFPSPNHLLTHLSVNSVRTATLLVTYPQCLEQHLA